MTVASPPPPPYGAPAPKKGMGPLGWIAIGCGAIVVLGVIAVVAMGWFAKRQIDKYKDNPGMAAAELIVRANPELELVSTDADKNTMTVKNTKTGEVVTFNAEDIKEGRFTFESAEGKTVIDASSAGDSGSVKMTGPEGAEVTWGGQAPKDLPSWVPVYPGSDVQGAMDATNADGRTASFAVATADGIDEVIRYYETAFEEAGLKVSKTTMETNGEPSAILTGTSDDNKRTVTAMIGAADGKTSANISFQAKN